ncbi:hypothetical protein, partial [Lactobacillus helveticus]|uniref:hypothetical protein n=1 Tax=Lactobacillus helveticus TaxID=1587 RepID=UPI001C64B8B2
EQVLHKTMFIQYFWKNATSDNLNRKTSALIKPYVKIQNGTEVSKIYKPEYTKKLSNFAERSK